MPGADKTLFAFVDPKDPFLLSTVAGEEQPGPILSLLAARPFDSLHLYHTPHTMEAAAATRREVVERYSDCQITVDLIAVSNPKNYSEVMGQLGRRVRSVIASSRPAENYVCVFSGTAEMRAAWFLLVASGALPATMLQIGSPAEPLSGAAHVREVELDVGHWGMLRDLMMPVEFHGPPTARSMRSILGSRAKSEEPVEAERISDLLRDSTMALASMGERKFPNLDDALQELGIFVASASLRDAAERTAIAAEADVPVMLLGETGTGKELFARLTHRISDRRDEPFIPVNCAAIPKELVESFLFGHIKGAFTGAAQDQAGKFENADGGTLFLDEIGELPPEAQAKLLRVLQDGQVEPLGSNQSRDVDVRIIAATNRDLAQEIEAGRFREDLYYRLEVVQVRLPPLRERRAEIPNLAVSLLDRINQRWRRPRRLSKAALERLERHDWPGNVRELSNVLERSALYCRNETLEPEELIITERASSEDPLTFLPDPEPGFSMDAFLGQVRRQLFLRAIEKSGGNQSEAAKLLGVTRQAVSRFVLGENDNPG